MITVTYYYSACVGIRTGETSILCDPWFTDGAYDGAWYQYPRLADPLSVIPEYEFVYVSHIHPDHYDAVFLRSYLQKHPQALVVIGETKPNYLSHKMKADGIPHEVHAEGQKGRSRWRIFPNDLLGSDIDSALAVVRDDHSVVNMNDNLYNPGQLAAIKAFLPKRPSIALLGYTGAGPYPQTYYTDSQILEKKAEEKKQDFFGRYQQMRDALGPLLTIPFAGQYVLGGALHELNPFRGVADAVEVAEFDASAVILADGGQASVDTSTLRPTAVRTAKYLPEDVRAYTRRLSGQPMTYEVYFRDLDPRAVPFRRLLPQAYDRALARSVCESDHYLCIRLPEGWFAANTRKGAPSSAFVDQVEDRIPRSEITVDLRYLYGLLTGVFHWNNAEVGSQYRTHRVPDVFQREFSAFMSFFHV